MALNRRVRRTRRGDFELRLPDSERAILKGLPGQMREALSDATPEDDPAIRRLYPHASHDDEVLSDEYHRLMDEELTTGRLAAFDTLEATADAEQVSEAELMSWLRAVNDIRLLLGVRLDVKEDEQLEVADDDPRAPAVSLYWYLSQLEEQIVEALSR